MLHKFTLILANLASVAACLRIISAPWVKIKRFGRGESHLAQMNGIHVKQTKNCRLIVVNNIVMLLQRNAMLKRGLCCRPVSFRPPVRHVRVLYPDG